MEIKTNREDTMHTAGMGFTEREWENLWNSETATSTVHRATDDNGDDVYCENCDSAVLYNGPNDVHGTCKCDEQDEEEQLDTMTDS